MRNLFVIALLSLVSLPSVAQIKIGAPAFPAFDHAPAPVKHPDMGKVSTTIGLLLTQNGCISDDRLITPSDLERNSPLLGLSDAGMGAKKVFGIKIEGGVGCSREITQVKGNELIVDGAGLSQLDPIEARIVIGKPTICLVAYEDRCLIAGTKLTIE